MNECPKCRSTDVHRSRSRTVSERWWKDFTTSRIFSCVKCGWRGWGVPTESATGISRDITDPDFAKLDSLKPIANLDENLIEMNPFSKRKSATRSAASKREGKAKRSKR